MRSMIKKSLLIGLLLSQPIVTLAQPVTVDVNTASGGQPVQGGGGRIEELIKLLRNMGLYLGFNLDKPPAEPIVTRLVDTKEDSQGATPSPRLDASNMVNSFLGAVPMTISDQTSDDDNTFVPSVVSFAKSINDKANATFTKFGSPQKGDIRVNELMDQKEYQQDPVSQALLNILTTPDSSWCRYGTDEKKVDLKKCPLLFRDKIIGNVIGEIPQFFIGYKENKQVLSQLNSNSLTAPLMYSLKPTAAAGNNSQNLTSTQASQAANFVKYAISDVLPLQLIPYDEAMDLYRHYYEVVKNGSTQEKDIRAKDTLEIFLASLRVYAAQRSVAISNLYDIMSRRVSQAPKSDAGQAQPTSEALSEFTMAAWRLKNIGDGKEGGPSQDWIKHINKASSETVQKEIALLLAEMNYQMYLSRQQQEKLLLTNTMILIQNMKGNEPSLREIKEKFAMNQAEGKTQINP